MKISIKNHDYIICDGCGSVIDNAVEPHIKHEDVCVAFDSDGEATFFNDVDFCAHCAASYITSLYRASANWFIDQYSSAKENNNA